MVMHHKDNKMDKKAEKLKDIIKNKPAPKSSFGTDPNEPWSAKAGITEENLSEDEMLNQYFISKGLNPKTASKISKISASKTGDFERWKQRRVRGGRLPEETELEEGNSLLNAYLKSRGLNPDHVNTKQKIAYTKGHQFQKWLSSHVSGGQINLTGAKYREGGLPEEVDPGIADVKGSVNATAKRQQQLNKRQSMHKVTTAPGLHKEDVYQDPKAATQTVFDGANNTNDTCSKSARMIKDLYRKKLREDLYDHEKADKSVATYGKKPKHDKADPKESHGEKKPKAAAVLSGGTTLTGEPRDTIEIDPMMRVRPGQPDPTKDKDKDKDKKKDKDNKKDK